MTIAIRLQKGGMGMSRESSSNLRFYCSKHAPTPKGIDGDPVTLIGKCVKLGFDAHHNRVTKEHM